MPAVYNYKYNITGRIIFSSDDIEELESKNITSVVIDHQYDDLHMPILYVNFALQDSIIYKLVENQEKSTIILNIQKYVYEEDKQPLLLQDYINNEFIYFIMDDYSKSDESESLDDEGINVSNVSVGLLDKELVNSNKKTLNGIVSGKPLSIAYSIINSGRNILMEPTSYNNSLSNILLPTVDSKYQLLDYINNLSCFYDTKFRYFNDFDITYFLSRSGNNVQKKNDKYDTVYLDIINYSTSDALYEGMTIDSDTYSYRVNISESNADKIDNSLYNRSYTSIRGITQEGQNIKDINNSDNNISSQKVMNLKINNGNTTIISNIKSEIESSKVTISISKNNLDNSIFTINRKYIVNSNDTYGQEYSGQYLLKSKQELYRRFDEYFESTIFLTLNKL